MESRDIAISSNDEDSRPDPSGNLILFRECSVGSGLSPAMSPIFQDLTWSLKPGEAWVITGSNGSGKSAFAAALAGLLPITPGIAGAYINVFAGHAVLVSFENAAEVIERERANDDSDFVEGGIDPGTSVRRYLAEMLPPTIARKYPGGIGLENHPSVIASGIAPILDRGLKRLSTGEIRRTLLCRALAAEPELLILDEPFEGLDTASRAVLDEILDRLASVTARTDRPPTSRRSTDDIPSASPTVSSNHSPILVLVADRWEHVPPAMNRVLELKDKTIAFSGDRSAYEALLARRTAETDCHAAVRKSALLDSLGIAEGEAATLSSLSKHSVAAGDSTQGQILVELRNVNVGWSGKNVLENISWTVRAGEHWLVRGPNGSGKTTLLELITGDNPQLFSNDVRIFGNRRGCGETIWEIKAKMGIVSYRLHLEYRYFQDLSLEELLVSGLHDSIGLYIEPGDAQLRLARRWLALAGFEGRDREHFGQLSYGEQRAILVARAAIKNPSLLILDEPCHGLDTEHRARVLELLESIASHGRSTLLHVTHDPSEVLACEKHILELRPGESPMWAILSSR
jgi:molybdate transport system ATP-binding protein